MNEIFKNFQELQKSWQEILNCWVLEISEDPVFRDMFLDYLCKVREALNRGISEFVKMKGKEANIVLEIPIK